MFRLFTVYISFTIFLYFTQVISASGDKDVLLEVHHVGQGNCITLTVKDKENTDKGKGKGKGKAKASTQEPEYMIIDIGSSSYNKDLVYTQAQPTFSSTNFSSPELNTSFVEEGDFESSLKDQKVREDSFLKEDFLSKMRKKLGETRKGIHVKTVVITHPDVDHYNWLINLFKEPEDQIDNIIFGGLPEHYDVSRKLNFRPWLGQLLKKGTNVYFPAIQYEPIKGIKDVENKGQHARHFYMHPNLEGKTQCLTEDGRELGEDTSKLREKKEE